MKKKITVDANVDTWVDVDIYIEDIIDEIDDECILKECFDRKLIKEEKELSIIQIKELLCDRYSINHLSDWELIINKLKSEVQ